MNNKEVIKCLNELLTKNYDSEKGYKTAAENVRDPKLISMFNRYGKQRYDFGHAIKNEIKLIGGEPDKGTSFTGDVHRAWMDFKIAFTDDNKEQMLAECVRGEKACLEDYNDKLDKIAMPASTRNMIIGQRDAVLDAFNTMEYLEEAEAES